MNPIQLTPEDLLGIEVNRCYRSKVQCESGDEVYRALENTHRIFNQKVAEVLRHILEVLNNDANPEFAKLTRWAILNISPAGQCSSHFANPFTLPESKANPTHIAYNKVPEMKILFLQCKDRGDRWYSREEVFGSLIEGKGASGLVSEVNQAAIEKVSAYLTLLEKWHEGEFTPPTLMKSDEFVKKYSGFLKKNRDLLQESNQFECLHKLLELKDAQLKGRLRDMHSTQLAYSEELSALGKAYQDYSAEALGKKAWLKQRQAFVTQNTEFLEQYQTILESYKKTLDKNSKQTTGETNQLPRAWYRDPNFLQVIEHEGPKQTFGQVFKSPLGDLKTLEEWTEQRIKHPDWPEFKDIQKIGPHWDARHFYVQKLQALNPALFAKDGWFGLLKAYRPYEGKKYTEFRKPPALRFPDPDYHPEWLTLSDKGCFQYRNLTIIGAALINITVNLIEPNTNTFKPYTFPVKLDNRLKTLQPAQPFEVPKGRWKKDPDTGERFFDWQPDTEGNHYEQDLFYPWVNPKSGEVYRISIHGGNLLHRNQSFYLHFRYTYKAPLNQGIKNTEQIDSSLSYKSGTKLLGFDLGQKADAVIAMMQDGNPVKFIPFHFKKTETETKPVYFQWIKLPGGNSFKAINHAERIRKKKLSKMRRREAHWLQELASKGKIPPKRKVKGLFAARRQETLKRLSTYIQHCREQHFKQLAGVIVQIAEANGCHGIVHENLENYRMSIKQRRFENQRLQIWAAQKTLDFIKTLCEAKGILCFPKSAAYTSQTCSHPKCASWGVRFNIPSKQVWTRSKYNQLRKKHEQPIPLIEAGGDWFLCSNETCPGKKEPKNPETRYILQADANAAKNLLLRAFKKDHWGAQISDEKERENIKESLQKWLIEVYAPKLAGKKAVLSV